MVLKVMMSYDVKVYYIRSKNFILFYTWQTLLSKANYKEKMQAITN